MDVFSLTTNPPKCLWNLKSFSLVHPTKDTYDITAKQLAEELANPQLLIQQRNQWKIKPEKNANKPAQVRKFYNELCMWEQKAMNIDNFRSSLPLIKMMNAKVAYARGRELVDEKFVVWFSTCMDQISEADENGLATLKNFRTHFEAVLGFFKQVRPS